MAVLRWVKWSLPLVFSLSVACLAEGPKEKKVSESHFFKSSSKPLAVTAFSVVGREVPLIVNASGKTEVLDRFVAKAPTSVKVQRVFVEEGDRVQAGDPLVKFDDQESGLRVAKAKADIREAEAGLSNDNYLKANRDALIEEGKLTEVEANGLDQRIELRQATIDRAKAEIDLYEKLTDLVQLNSPIAGLVTKKSATEGAQVAEDQELIEVVRLDPVQFVFTVPVDAVSSMEKGAEITVKFSSFPGQDFSGQVASVGAEAGGEGGGITIKLNLPNPDLFLKADMGGEVVIRTPIQKKIFPIVEAALVKSDKSNYVYKIDGGKVKKVAVELGQPLNGQPVVEKGLSEGDMIVASANGEEMKDGTPVEVQTVRASK